MRLSVCFILLASSCLAQDRFYHFKVDQDRLSGAPDFSFLNRPLQPSDRLFVRDGHFYRVGRDLQPNTRDDERVRLFGVNAVFGACFPEERDAARIAKRLRRLGVNLVRLHHMDTSPDRDPNEARSLLTTGPYPTLNPVSVPRLRNFLNALKEEGIYVNLNLHVGYVFRPEVDRVPAMPDGQAMPTHSKPLHIFYPRMVELQAEFARKVIKALSLKNDPVLAMVEINNETSLVEAWQRGSLERYAVGEYKIELERQWHAFLKTKYGDAAPRGDPANDYLSFLVERDRTYLQRMRAAVHEAADPLVPVTGTQMGFGGLLNLDSHAELEYLDNHFYIDHYNFPNQRWDARDWRIRDTSSTGSGLATFFNVAAAREWGKPYTVSEYNQPWPNRQAAEIDPTLAAFAAFQDWDSIMHFAYSHNRNWDNPVPSGFDLNGDWTKWVNFGQAALLFRTAAVRPGRLALEAPVSKEVRLRAAREKRIGAVAAALAASLGYDPALGLLHRVGVVRDETRKFQPRPAAGVLRSDTGELVYDRKARVLVIQAQTAAGVFGFARRACAGAVEIELAPSSRGFVALLVTPLDGRPIKESTRLLLTIPGYTLASLPGTDPPRPQRFIPYLSAADWWTVEPEPGSPKPSGSRNGGVPPVWMERVESFVTLKTSRRRMSVYPLDGAGNRLKALGAGAVARVKDGLRFHLQADGQPLAPWYELAEEK